jgi:quinol monooxygenase YgiN
MARFGLHGKITAHPGEGDALIALLLEASEDLEDAPGCDLYVIHRALDDPDAIWITEAWESREAHAASLSLDSVKAVIERARPLIAGMSDRVETVPVGGKGLPPADAGAVRGERG